MVAAGGGRGWAPDGGGAPLPADAVRDAPPAGAPPPAAAARQGGGVRGAGGGGQGEDQDILNSVTEVVIASSH